MRRELLRLENINYGERGRHALSGFSLALCAGEILGIYSTHDTVKDNLIAIIAGHLGADAGRVYLDDEASPFEEADARRRRKVGVIHSVRTLIDVLSVAENIFIVRQGVKAGVIDMPLLMLQARLLLDEFGLSLAPQTLAADLGGFERCALEMLKAMALGARIVILHDLSSFLPDAEIERLLELAGRLRGKGVGFLLVDSSPQCLAAYADRVSVIKNGRNYWTFARGEFGEEAVKTCFARSRESAPLDRGGILCAGHASPPALVFEAVAAVGLEDCSFTLQRGQELCLLDLHGRGVDAVQALLSGALRPDSGHILVDGLPFNARNTWQALDQKIAFIVESPADRMIFRDLTALENLCLPASRKASDFWLNPVYRLSCLREYAPHFTPGALDCYPEHLSVQDRHKLVYCRWHLYKPGVVVCVKPYSSVDKTLEEISARYIGELREKGIAVLILTSSAAEADAANEKIVLNQKNAPPHPKNAL